MYQDCCCEVDSTLKLEELKSTSTTTPQIMTHAEHASGIYCTVSWGRGTAFGRGSAHFQPSVEWYKAREAMKAGACFDSKMMIQ